MVCGGEAGRESGGGLVEGKEETAGEMGGKETAVTMVSKQSRSRADFEFCIQMTTSDMTCSAPIPSFSPLPEASLDSPQPVTPHACKGRQISWVHTLPVPTRPVETRPFLPPLPAYLADNQPTNPAPSSGLNRHARANTRMPARGSGSFAALKKCHRS